MDRGGHGAVRRVRGPVYITNLGTALVKLPR